jgi:anti-sigma regulatory factor (Ser/Thr protein kinase)/CheY-like chemotaxis protein
MARLLAVDPDPGLVTVLGETLAGHDIETAAGDVEALVRLRGRVCDVVITDPDTAVAEDLAFAAELRKTRPGVRVIVLAPEVKHEDVVEALRAQVFACFTPPYDYPEIASMARAALTAPDWRHGIEVVSGLPHWLTLRVSCHLLTAERLVRFMTEHPSTSTLPADDRDLLITAFREMLVNAMEHGAGFNPDQVIEVTAARTGRAIVYHFRDPGSGFDREDLAHATASSTPESVRDAAFRRAERGLRPGGFGLLIARHIADELVFNERGNEVLLIKYL